MAVVLAFRLAIAIAERETAAIYTATGAGGGAALTLPIDWLRQRLAAGDSPEELSAALSEQIGYPASVATFPAPFELRHFSMQFTIGGPLGSPDDHRQCGFDVLKLASGAPTDAWTTADFTTVANALDAFWTTLRPSWPNELVLDRLVAHKRGPALVPPLPAVWEADRDVAGSSAGVTMPPQLSISVTERTSGRRHWGRFYLPACSGSGFDTTTGRILPAMLTAIADAGDTLYETLRTAGLPIVVYSAPKPRRWPGAEDERWRTKGDYPAEAGAAYTVDKLQVDDVPDVIRSRRHKARALAVIRDIGA